MTELQTRPLCTMTLRVDTILPEGPRAPGDRLVGIVAGGSFEGERLRGTVLPGGNDWLVAREGGLFTIDVRLPLQTDDGAIIAMHYRGMRVASPEVVARARRGEPVERSAYRVRMSSLFETSAAKYAWINHVIGLGLGTPQPGGIRYDMFELL